MAWRFKPNTKFRTYRGQDLDADMLEVLDPAKGDLQRVDFIGSGVLMFPVDCLLALKKPWFSERFSITTMKRMASMDTGFVWELKVVGGADVWVDMTIKVKHLNTFPIDETFQDRFPDWQEAGYGETVLNP